MGGQIGSIQFGNIQNATSGTGLTGFHNTYIPFGDAAGGLHDTVDTGIGQLNWNNGLLAAGTNAGIPGTFLKIGSTAYTSTLRVQTDDVTTNAKSLMGYGKGFTDYWYEGLDNVNFVLRNALNNVNVHVVSQTFGRTGFGMVGIAAPSNPTAMLHFAASDGAQNNAPLKFTSGALMATGQAGAMEFNGDRLYITQTTGNARKVIVLWSQTSPGGNSFVPFVNGTNGQLDTSVDFQYQTAIQQLRVGANGTGTVRVGIASGLANAFLMAGAGTTALASLFIGAGVAPAAPADGQIWNDGTNLFMRIGGVTKTFTLV